MSRYLILLIAVASIAAAAPPSEADALSYMLAFNRRLVDGDIETYLGYVPDTGLVTIDLTKPGHPQSIVPKTFIRKMLQQVNSIPDANKLASGVAPRKLQVKKTTTELELSAITLIPLTTGEILAQRNVMTIVLEQRDGRISIHHQEVLAADDLGTLKQAKEPDAPVRPSP